MDRLRVLECPTRKNILEFFKQIFSRGGVPLEMVSDNGTQLFTAEMYEFLHSCGTIHLKTSLYHNQGNGQVEWANCIIKETIQVALKCNLRVKNS